MSIDQLKNLLANHRARGATDSKRYIGILDAYEARVGKGLSFDKSLAIIRAAAEERKFLSYKDLADESGVEWNKVRYEVNAHLGRLIEYSHRKGWPMISSIVVNKANVETGKMETATLKGFVAAARDLGHKIGPDEEEFLRQQQQEVFHRAATGWDL